MRRSQAEQMRVVRVTKTALEDMATRGGAYVVWHEPDRQGFYTPTVYQGTASPLGGSPWRNVLIDALAVAMAVAAGLLVGVVLS